MIKEETRQIKVRDGPRKRKEGYEYLVARKMNGPDSSVVRGYGLGGGGPGFNPHHVKLSGLHVRPFKVSGGSPVHLRSKHRATRSRTWKEDLLGQQKEKKRDLVAGKMMMRKPLC